MIRPSALPMARKCLHASLLAEKYPEESSYSEEGKELHEEIANDLLQIKHAESEEAKRAISWALARYINSSDRPICVEKEVKITDPFLGVVTSGKPDLLVLFGRTLCVVIDWKSGEANVDSPDDNLQLLTYGTAACEEYRCESFIPVVYKTKEGIPIIGRSHGADEHLEEIIALASTTDKEREEPHPGPHCLSCYQRRYCHSWQSRQAEAASLIVPMAEELKEVPIYHLLQRPEMLTLLSERIKMVDDALETAKAVRLACIKQGGLCVVNGKKLIIQVRDGKESIDKDALTRDGLLEKYTKKGKPYDHPTWVKHKEGK